MRPFLTVSIGFLLMALNGCQKENISIKEYKIDFEVVAQTVSQTDKDRILGDKCLYRNFNKNNYENCKSIVFVGAIKVSPKTLKFSKKDTCFLELYNLTDSVNIPHSTLYSTSETPVWLESENLLSDFPNKDIDLTLRLRMGNEIEWGQLISASLYINFSTHRPL